jgi:Zn-dependent metalloprotease
MTTQRRQHVKLLNRGLALAVVGAGLAALPTLGAQALPAAAGDNGLRAMTAQADGSVAVSGESATGKVGFIRVKGDGDLMPGRAGDSAAAAVAKSEAYLAKYAGNFGARAGELDQSAVTRNKFGWTVIYKQAYQGVPVFGGTLKANVDLEGDLTSVSGFAAPDLDLSVTPGRSASEAAQRAVTEVKVNPPTTESGASSDVTGLRAASTELVIYRQGAVRGDAGKAVLAYEVEVTNVTKDGEGGNIRDHVFLDASTLKPVNRYSDVHEALDRQLITSNYSRSNPPGTPVAYRQVWREGQPFPGTLTQDQQNLVLSTGESYSLFFNTFGVDSFDDAGSTMVTLHNRPDSCPNASWNGSYTSYCAGVYADDIVSHEWGHAYTEYNSGLIYQWQSGALNEAYSDVWGETLDQLNGREDQGEVNAPREDGVCSLYTRGEITAVINSPAEVAGPCQAAAPAAFGPQFTTAGTTADVVVATDAADQKGPLTTDGCSTITNPGAVSGKWAYVDRGTCAFIDKIDNVMAAGAKGIVFGNNRAGVSSVSGDYDIPGLMVSQADGTRIKSVGAVNMTVKELARTATDSHRWLIGEKSTAFGGAIRDMWNPTCYGDPGKVSDAEYHCSSDDNGGVHGNSAVPNHGYALLVDGGTFNGQTVSGIGLDKAANIYFKAQNEYLTETSDFVDHADSLEAACTALVGRPINKLNLEVGGTATPAAPVTTADCDQVTKVIAAVELRTDPTVQCEWEPILAKDAPALCGEDYSSRVVFEDDFDAGISAWTKDQTVVFPGGRGFPWRTSATYPGRDNVGRVAVGPTPDEGDCMGDDVSSSDSITSPSVLVPAGKALRLSFDHYIATEAGYDGGNVKISVNGGDFTVIPAAAYVFNGPNALPLKTEAEDSTNPLAGEEGFSGTNPGKSSGSWGQSQVNLEAAGAKAGDSIQVRFDIGRDGCGGVDGWYVDNVAISVCENVATKVTAVHVPEPSTFGTASTVDVTVSSDNGGVPTGTVDLVKADGSKVASGALAGGKVSLTLPKDLPVGTHVLTAKYLGNGGGFQAASGTVTVTVKAGPVVVDKSKSETKMKIKPKKPAFKQDFKAVVKVKSLDGATPTGTVKFRLDGKKLAKKTLKDGRVVLKVKKNIEVGRHMLVAKYVGDTATWWSRDRLRFFVVR